MFSRKRIYLDTSATTPVDKRVLKAMQPYFSKKYGNPSSIYAEGVEARKVLEKARKTVADILHAHSDEIIFTNGGTESDNLAILGVARALLKSGKIEKPGHIITTQIEHRAVLEPCKLLEEEGWAVTYLPVEENGIVDTAELKAALRSDTVLVSAMYVNNEIGTIEPIKEIKKILKAHKQTTGKDYPYFHTDACQAARFLSLNIEQLGTDLLTANGSKIYGPKGTGFLYIKRGVPCRPIILGGGQERDLRSGTENIPAIVGLAEALSICDRKHEKESSDMVKLRDYFIAGLKKIKDTEINGDVLERSPNNINVTFRGVDAEFLVIELDARDVACSTGSACSSRAKHESHVILALGKNLEYANSTVRFTLGRETGKADIDYVLKILPGIIEKIRSIKI